MRLRVIVFRAVGAIEVALIGEVEAALQRLAVENTLSGFEQVIPGKFPANLVEQVHVDPRWDRDFTRRGCLCHPPIIANGGMKVDRALRRAATKWVRKRPGEI